MRRILASVRGRDFTVKDATGATVFTVNAKALLDVIGPEFHFTKSQSGRTIRAHKNALPLAATGGQGE
ncbi:hypothetical protein [Microbacterium sp. ZW T5_56]|uniref:hypothetical protein n=1 Tax=Microbacterium sp. ZW T5_56 TaxID=3378081 RepID=UPI0038535B1C